VSGQGRWMRVVAIVALLAVAALGALAYTSQIQHGEVVTGMRSVGAGGAVWGLYVVMDGCFLGGGIALMAIACIARFTRDRSMEAAARIAMPSAITCFLGAALCVLADQGRPLAALMNLSLYARPQSPMFVTFTSVGAVCLFGSLLHCVLARRPDLAEYAKRPSAWQGLQRVLAAGYQGTPAERSRRRKASLWMSLGMLAALSAPATALAILFVGRISRSVDVVVIEMSAFLVISFAGGLGILVIAAALVRRFAGPGAGLSARGSARLGRWLLVAVSLSALLLVVAEVASVGSDTVAVAAFGSALLGNYRGMFWTALTGLFLAAGLLWPASRRRRRRERRTVLASLIVQVSMFLHHDWLLVAWQTHGLALPYGPGRYSPTRIEWGVAAGIVAVCILLLLPAVRLIPFAPVALEAPSIPTKSRDLRRSVLTFAWLVSGLAVASIGLLGSARVAADASGDPSITGSPVVFILGLMLLATTGAVYELLPERK